MLSTPHTPVIRKDTGSWRCPGISAKQAILSYWMSLPLWRGVTGPVHADQNSFLQVSQGNAMASAFDS